MKDESKEAQGEDRRKVMNRRHLLAMATVAAAGLASASIAGKAAKAQEGMPLLMEIQNYGGTQRTALHAQVNTPQPDDVPGNSAAAFVVNNDAERLHSNDILCAIMGACTNGIGVWGGSRDGWAVHGNSNFGIGVYGHSPDGQGVRGRTEHGTFGVEGWGDEVGSVGVYGHSQNGVGIRAESPYGTALKVDGKGNLDATIEWPDQAFQVSNHADPVSGDGWVWPISIAGVCEKGVGMVGYGSHMGVHGKTEEGAGVNGGSDTGTGVSGESNSGIGVSAMSKTGTALKVDGRSECRADLASGNVFSVDNESPQAAYPWAAAVMGHCKNGIGLLGMSDAGLLPGPSGKPFQGLAGVEGVSLNGFGVQGLAGASMSQDFVDWILDINRGNGGLLGYAGSGRAVVGFSDTGIGVEAISKGTAMQAESADGTGIVGRGKSIGIQAYSKDGEAIDAYCDSNSATGVAIGARSGSMGIASIGGKVGVNGGSASGTGVVGASNTGIGVRAFSQSGTALRVEGRSSFSTVGKGTIPKLKKSVTLNLAPGSITDKSHVSVMLTSDPNAVLENAAVSYVDRDPVNNKLTINLTKVAGKETSFTYFIVEP